MGSKTKMVTGDELVLEIIREISKSSCNNEIIEEIANKIFQYKIIVYMGNNIFEITEPDP